MQRTAVFLSRYNIVPRHVKGSDCVADALSRWREMLPADGVPEPDVRSEEGVEFVQVMAAQLADEQAKGQVAEAQAAGSDFGRTCLTLRTLPYRLPHFHQILLEEQQSSLDKKDLCEDHRYTARGISTNDETMESIAH